MGGPRPRGISFFDFLELYLLLHTLKIRRMEGWEVYMSQCCGGRHLYEVDEGRSSYLRDRCVSKKSGIPISDINCSTHRPLRTVVVLTSWPVA